MINSIISRHHINLIVYNALRFVNWLIIPNLNHIFYVKSNGTINPFRGKKILETSKGILGGKILIGCVGKKTQCVTFTCSYCH